MIEAKKFVRSYNYGFIDEATKKEIRRKMLKGVAIPGYQVPYSSPEMPISRGWGTGGLHGSLSLIGQDDVFKIIDQGSDASVNACNLRDFVQRMTGCRTTFDTAEATIIQYLHPTFTGLIAAMARGERLSLRTTLASAVSLFGVVLVAGPGWLAAPAATAGVEPTVLPPLALAAAVGGAFFSGAAYVVVRRLASREDPLVIVLYFPLVTVPATLPAVVFDFVLPRGMDWLWLGAIGVLTQLGQVWLTRGLQQLPAARGTALSYVQVVFAIVWGAVFFAEIPRPASWLGALLVVGGTLGVALAPAAGDAEPPAR